ncbi:PfkB family carbohydrate kinase [Isoptericola sp. b490]|uniref:PfkB family carbohydrate kinase n=1 Tax=Actinotalea lenta TaxID=3064654 RepID=UPI00271405AB|nr:PfkB family carbohydrate kinase [Isoptericola sp. b490]MDO8120333.1 PfkB family carbohydrate kinase [Isoptericola sp. b490]
MIQLREAARWALVVPTSMGVRLTPENGQPVHASSRFVMQATSAETNVASVVSHLGLPVKVLTTFVAGSPIAAFIKSDLAARHMVVEGPEVPQGGAWGLRHQFNIADSGYGARAPRVHNDRAGEVGRTLAADAFDLDRIFRGEGVQVLHLSGLVAALSPDTSAFCVALARAARTHGTVVAFDLNHRASFWAGREAELRAAFTEIAEHADVLVGNEEDFQLALGIPGPQVGGEGLEAELEGFTEMIGRIHDRFPSATLVATTLREVLGANRHLWGALVSDRGQVHVAAPREIGVLDRIGGGDGFVGGLLYGLLRGWDARRCLEFGWATGALAATVITDHAAPADEAQVWSIWQGNARVQR